MWLIVFLYFTIENSLSKTLPSYIHKCSKSDPNLNNCLNRNALDAAQKLKNGNKELGIAPLEPLLIKKVDMGNVTRRVLSLQMVFENMKLFEMTNATVSDSDANFTGDNCYWNYKCSQQFVRMESDYAMRRKLLFFSIKGHGKCASYLYDVGGDFGAKCERYTKRNKTHLRITDFYFNMRTPKKIIFDFENIIDGNEQLSKEVVKVLNENSKSVYKEVGPALNEVMAFVWKETINQIFSRVPEDELFLP